MKSGHKNVFFVTIFRAVIHTVVNYSWPSDFVLEQYACYLSVDLGKKCCDNTSLQRASEHARNLLFIFGCAKNIKYPLGESTQAWLQV